MYEGQLFVVSGPSGTGKGTICKMFLEEATGACLSISMTTRRPRPGEAHGESYYFISHEEFQSKIEAEGFFEYAHVYGNYYGTPKQEVLDTLKQGIDVILEIDTQGALQVKKWYPKGIFIFILPPSMAELRRRLTTRGAETEEEINLRMSKAMAEISFINEYNYYIVNADLTESVGKMNAIVTAERSRVSQTVHHIIKEYREEI